MFCSRCGTPADQHAKFCLKCGTQLMHIEQSAHESVNAEVYPSLKEVGLVRPWVRYWARIFDIYVFCLAVGFILGMFEFEEFLDNTNDVALGMILVFIWILVEAILLSSFQTTPGKWLFKTKLTTISGEQINFSQAFSRSLKVWWRGLGTGFPIATLITHIIAYKNLTRDGITSWDRESGFTVTHAKIGIPRVIVAVAFFVGFFIFVAIGGNV